MTIYNQYDYGGVPYPSPSMPGATVKSGGCGVVSMMIVLKNLMDVELTASQAAEFAMSAGARVNGGTDMVRLGRAMCEKWGLSLKLSDDAGELVAHLEDGGLAVVNSDGNRGSRGIFSDGGHYLVAVSADGDRLRLIDPGWYASKYTGEYRRQYVRTLSRGLIEAPVSALEADTLHSSPGYYLFGDDSVTYEKFCEFYERKMEELKEAPPSDWSREARLWAEENGLIKGDAGGRKMYKKPLTREEYAVMAYRQRG